MSDTPSDIDQLEIRAGRRAPYSQVGDWVMLADLKHPSVRLYWALVAHINVSRSRNRDDRDVWPTMEVLARMLRYSRRDKVLPFIAELVAIGAIDVEQIPVIGGGSRTRSRYTVHETPPPGYAGPESLGDFYAILNAEREAKKQANRAAAEPADDPGEDEQPGEPRYPDSGTGPVPEMRYRSGTSNEVRNKTKKQDVGNKSGGASRRPPTPPADLTAGHVDLLVTSSGDYLGDQQTARADELAIVVPDAFPNVTPALEGPETPARFDGDGQTPAPGIIGTMTLDRTGEEREDDDAGHYCRNGWLTPADADAPKPCPRCRDRAAMRRRPVREYVEPNPSPRAAAAWAAAEDAEETGHDRERPVECPVTFPTGTGT